MIIAFGTSEDGAAPCAAMGDRFGSNPSQTVSTQGVYYYQVSYAKAKDSGRCRQESARVSRAVHRRSAHRIKKGPAEQAAAVSLGKTRVMVDEGRNGIIFQGTAEEFAQFRTLMKQMDRAPLEVLIEATVAEV